MRNRFVPALALASLLAFLPFGPAATASEEYPVQISGWLDFEYNTTRRQGVAEPEFDQWHYYQFVDARASEKWRGFAEMEFEHVVKFTDGSLPGGEFKLERAFIEYNYSTAHNFRVGKWSNPLGIWKRAHYAILEDATERPIEVRNEYIPNRMVGIHYFGRVLGGYFEDAEYNLFYTSGDDNTRTDQTDLTDEYGYGVSVQGRRGNWLIGACYLVQKSEPVTNSNRKDKMPAVWLEVHGLGGLAGRGAGSSDILDRLTFRSEAFLVQRGDSKAIATNASSKAGDANSWYGSLKYDLTGYRLFGLGRHVGENYLCYRYDRGHDERRSGISATNFSKDRKLNLQTISWGVLPIPNVRWRLEWNSFNFDDPSLDDYEQWDAWIGFMF